MLGVLGEIGLNGVVVGIGGLSNVFGFKLDMYYNIFKLNLVVKVNVDLFNVVGGGVFGVFVIIDSYGVVIMYILSLIVDNVVKLKV